MARGTGYRLACVALAGLAGGCASILGKNESEVAIRTNPPASHCDLKGRDGFAAAVDTPATVSLPTAAAPLTVTCVAPGYRPTVYTLDTTADGWMWGNGALIAVTGGVAVVGALVDGSRDAGVSYSKDVNFDLDLDQPRLVRVRDRASGASVNLQAR